MLGMQERRSPCPHALRSDDACRGRVPYQRSPCRSGSLTAVAAYQSRTRGSMPCSRPCERMHDRGGGDDPGSSQRGLRARARRRDDTLEEKKKNGCAAVECKCLASQACRHEADTRGGLHTSLQFTFPWQTFQRSVLLGRPPGRRPRCHSVPSLRISHAIQGEYAQRRVSLPHNLCDERKGGCKEGSRALLPHRSSAKRITQSEFAAGNRVRGAYSLAVRAVCILVKHPRIKPNSCSGEEGAPIRACYI